MKTLIYLFAFQLLGGTCFAQIEHLIYIDVSKQNNRLELARKVDSIVEFSAGNKLIMVSNGSTPLLIYTQEQKKEYDAAIKSINPSTPSPYYDLDTLISSSYTFGGLSDNAAVSFFLSAENALGRESHLQAIFERFLLSMRLVRNSAIPDNYSVSVFLNTDNIQENKDLPFKTKLIDNIVYLKY